MACFVQIFINTTIPSKIKSKKKNRKNKNISLPTQKLKNISETDLFFLGLSTSSMLVATSSSTSSTTTNSITFRQILT